MTQSMTAFARVQAQFDDMDLCWEIRSVNHRYLDVSFRLPEAWRYVETELRALIRPKIFRGKLECQLKWSEQVAAMHELTINEGLVDSLLKLTSQLALSKRLQNDITLSSLLNWPGVVQVTTPDVEKLEQHVLQLFHDALVQLQNARAREGESLKIHVQNRVTRLQEEITRAQLLVANSATETRDKLLTRLNSMQWDVESARVEQEIALILTKMDVSEELDRLNTHVQEVANVVVSPEAHGRRLDFLMQELNREANTLSSKSDSVALTQSAVEMKVLIEQMREQIQNIE